LRPITYLLAGAIAGCVTARYSKKIARIDVDATSAVATAS
jgi:hypothetical protein